MKYRMFLLLIFLAFLIWASYKPISPDDWLIENYLVFLYVPAMLIAERFLKLSNLSYTLITTFICLHLIASHYTYGEVPFGYTIGHWFGSDRNMYDRLVHFSFGLLFAYPIRELLIKNITTRVFWTYFLPINLIFSFSAIYEILEWSTVLNISPKIGLLFLGSQGDVWDTQKDMASAGIGAITAMLIVFLVHISLSKNVWKKIKGSFKATTRVSQ